MKFLGVSKESETFALMFFDRNKKIINNYFIQITLKEPWKYPHKENRFNNGSWLCGWGYFYFGNIVSEGNYEED